MVGSPRRGDLVRFSSNIAGFDGDKAVVTADSSCSIEVKVLDAECTATVVDDASSVDPADCIVVTRACRNGTAVMIAGLQTAEEKQFNGCVGKICDSSGWRNPVFIKRSGAPRPSVAYVVKLDVPLRSARGKTRGKLDSFSIIAVEPRYLIPLPDDLATIGTDPSATEERRQHLAASYAHLFPQGLFSDAFAAVGAVDGSSSEDEGAEDKDEKETGRQGQGEGEEFHEHMQHDGGESRGEEKEGDGELLDSWRGLGKIDELESRGRLCQVGSQGSEQLDSVESKGCRSMAARDMAALEECHAILELAESEFINRVPTPSRAQALASPKEQLPMQASLRRELLGEALPAVAESTSPRDLGTSPPRVPHLPLSGIVAVATPSPRTNISQDVSSAGTPPTLAMVAQALAPTPGTAISSRSSPRRAGDCAWRRLDLTPGGTARRLLRAGGCIEAVDVQAIVQDMERVVTAEMLAEDLSLTATREHCGLCSSCSTQ